MKKALILSRMASVIYVRDNLLKNLENIKFYTLLLSSKGESMPSYQKKDISDFLSNMKAKIQSMKENMNLELPKFSSQL